MFTDHPYALSTLFGRYLRPTTCHACWKTCWVTHYLLSVPLLSSFPYSTQVDTPSWTRSHTGRWNSSLHLWQRLQHGKRPCWTTEVQGLTPGEIICSITGHISQERERKQKPRNKYPSNKENPEIRIQVYDHHKPRCPEASIRTFQ